MKSNLISYIVVACLVVFSTPSYSMDSFGEFDNTRTPTKYTGKLNNQVIEESNDVLNYFLNSWLPNITCFISGVIFNECLNWGEGPIWKRIEPCCPISCKKFCCKPRIPTNNPDDEVELESKYGSTGKTERSLQDLPQDKDQNVSSNEI